MTDITIIINGGEPGPRFRLLAPDGGVPRITSVTVLDLGSEQPIWWLLVDAFSEAMSFEIVEPSEADIEQLASIDEIDPLEDLPSTDPRHRRALQERDEFEERTLILLGDVTYGVVPAGFRQVLPQVGPAPSLKGGGSYGIHVMGAGMAGYLPFEGGPRPRSEP